MSIDLADPQQALDVAPTYSAPQSAALAAAATMVARDKGQARSADQAIRLLARSLGRQAARRHLARGWSMIELAAALAAGALVLAAALSILARVGGAP